MFAKVLGEKRALIKVSAMMYNVVVQEVLLYGSMIWVMMDAMTKVLEEYHHRIARLIAEMTYRKGDDGEWEWASVNLTL